MKSSADERRGYSLLPPAIGLIVREGCLRDTLGDVLRDIASEEGPLPSCLSFISGPSTTADIASVHVVGVHGPREVFVWVIADGPTPSGDSGARRRMGRRATHFPVVRSLSVDRVEAAGLQTGEQRFTVPAAIDVASALEREWRRLGDSVSLDPGAEIAVAVGSRGIDRLEETVRLVVEKLLDAGCRPFIVPAMGSHGGATAEGQLEYWRRWG